MRADFDQKKVWVQRDGTPIAVKEMSDRHLTNTIAMLRRNAEAIRDGQMFVALLCPDDSVANAAELVMQRDAWKYLKRTPLVKAMRKELKRREDHAFGGLDV